MKNSNINPHILRYMEQVEKGEIQSCKEQKLLMKMVRKAFKTEEIYTDDEQLEKYLKLVKYFPYDEFFTWETFVLALHCCTYRKKDNRPRWPDLFLLIGRGAGKDGYIAVESVCLISEYNGIKFYDVDICANSELQAKAPFTDFHNVLESPEHTRKLKRFFYWNKEEIINLKTKSKMKYRTNNPKGKDGLRSGIVIFNEVHQYENYDNINVFTTGLGKKAHPRRTYATTNGKVRGGPLDDMVDKSLEILNGSIKDNGMLPFICRLDNKKEANNPKMWEKANPSLPYLPDLQEEIAKEYEDWKHDPSQFPDFIIKRMNLIDGNSEIAVTSWENILATKEEPPDLSGKSCICGIDYASISDFASVGLLFKNGNTRYWLTHSWLCTNSRDIPRLKIPWQEWEKMGYLTVVDDVEIHPDRLTEWIYLQGRKYHITKVALDNFRYALVSKSLAGIGFSAQDHKNVKLVRPSDQMIVSPVIESAFTNKQIIWGENPLMRWATNNTKMMRGGINKDKGNMTYGKIEPKSRKTDPFMAFVAAVTCESELDRIQRIESTIDIGVRTY